MIFRVSWSWCLPSSHKSTSIRASLHCAWPSRSWLYSISICFTQPWFTGFYVVLMNDWLSPRSGSTHLQPSESHRVGMDPPAFCITRLAQCTPLHSLIVIHLADFASPTYGSAHQHESVSWSRIAIRVIAVPVRTRVFSKVDLVSWMKVQSVRLNALYIAEDALQCRPGFLLIVLH